MDGLLFYPISSDQNQRVRKWMNYCVTIMNLTAINLSKGWMDHGSRTVLTYKINFIIQLFPLSLMC